jgi:hypothetical protein
LKLYYNGMDAVRISIPGAVRQLSVSELFVRSRNRLGPGFNLLADSESGSFRIQGVQKGGGGVGSAKRLLFFSE